MIPSYVKQRLEKCYPKGTPVSPSGMVAYYMREISSVFEDLFPHISAYDLSESMFNRKSVEGMTVDDWKVKVVITRTLEQAADTLEEYGEYDNNIVSNIFQQNIEDLEYTKQNNYDRRYNIAHERVLELSRLLYNCRHRDN